MGQASQPVLISHRRYRRRNNRHGLRLHHHRHRRHHRRRPLQVSRHHGRLRLQELRHELLELQHYRIGSRSWLRVAHNRLNHRNGNRGRSCHDRLGHFYRHYRLWPLGARKSPPAVDQPGWLNRLGGELRKRERLPNPAAEKLIHIDRHTGYGKLCQHMQQLHDAVALAHIRLQDAGRVAFQDLPAQAAEHALGTYFHKQSGPVIIHGLDFVHETHGLRQMINQYAGDGRGFDGIGRGQGVGEHADGRGHKLLPAEVTGQTVPRRLHER